MKITRFLEIYSTLNQNNFDIIIFGSNSSKDKDILIVNNNINYNCYSSTCCFLEYILPIIKSLDVNIIVSHEHRGFFLKESKEIFHLLFYPSYDYLLNWEPLSFISYIYDRGKYINGNKENLEKYYKCYRKRINCNFNISLTHKQLINYACFAIKNIIYLFVDSKLYNNEIYKENLLYFLRFVIIELLMDNLQDNDVVKFWDWEELVSYIKELYTEDCSVYKILSMGRRGEFNLTNENILQFFISSLNIIDKGIDGFKDMGLLVEENIWN